MDTTHPLRRRSLALVLALSAPVALLACSDDEPERATVRSESEEATDEGSGITGGTAEDAGSGEPDAGGSSGSRAEVIGTATGNHTADPIDDTLVPLRLDVHSVQRSAGDIVEVLFSITNEGDVPYEPYSTLGDPSGQSYDVGGAALLDAPNDKRYLTLYDSEDVCLCTDVSATVIAPGEAGAFSVQLTAPPEDVTEVTFTLPGFDPINGLEIS